MIWVYAQGKDYHDLVTRRLKRLGRWLIDQAARSSLDCEIKVFVDTAPVMEKPLAQAAGLGWQGKHTNLLGRDLGSWVFLGAIFTTLEFPPDAPEVSHCGTCTACLDICPTRAFPAPYQLDARRCISYLTIEHRGPVDTELRASMGNRIYGCDDCLAVCPWNKFAVAAKEIGYQPKHGLPELAELALDLGLEQALIWQSMYIFKQPGIGGEVRWHQDATFFDTVPITVTTFWFALEDATLDNGCLWVEPGGHRGPLRERFVKTGNAAASTALPHPPKTGQTGPKNSAANLFMLLNPPNHVPNAGSI